MPRRPKNHRPDLNGVLVVDKPLGVTSAAVCRRVRRITGGAKVGHAGTLDPLATGVLVVCLGEATKRVPELMAGEKGYLAEVDLSAFSTTDDMEGDPTPVEVSPGSEPGRGDVERVCAAFVGEIMQTPPVFSAIKMGGRSAYKLARAGEAPEMKARPALIHAIEVLAYEWPVVTIDVRCAKGTYIRSLARDIGVKLGTGGRLQSLRRTRVGPYTIDDAIALEEIPENPPLV
ncbi:MAG: tRNA pseudouridine(55) synthase TruB [Phycisphaeraceae bacterium]|nr:MAG: tRNA pseudouridine(55) synthase TruB [Phycisphaeraceae bacterium]